MNLENLPKRKNRKYKSKRLGRGVGSGVGGHVVGRGTKGQKSRAGHKSMVMFEGGNLPFYKRMPKYKGFKRIQKVKNQPINVAIIEDEYKTGETVNLESLKEKGLVRKRTTKIKILGYGELTKKLNFEGVAVSSSAKKKIEAAKGQIKE